MEHATFPHVQAIPHPDAVWFEHRGRPLFAYQFGRQAKRPFLFPVYGPAGRMTTRLGHPHDPVGHRHHYSIWCAHHDLNGHDFWTDQSGGGWQRHQDIVSIEDGEDRASLVARVVWETDDGGGLLEERRRVTARTLGVGECLLDCDSHVQALTTVEFGRTNFAWLAVRVAKTMGVRDGNGRITNSAGQCNEKQVFGKRSVWCDYSGCVAPNETNGITFIPHPSNRDYPPRWHVRDDGWMTACPFAVEGLRLTEGETLVLRHRLYLHSGSVDPERNQRLLQDYESEPAP